MSNIVKFKRLNENAIVPTKADEGSNGFDLYYDGNTIYHLTLMQPAMVSTGIAVEMPPSVFAFITPRSGLAKRGLTIMNAPGLIDNSYRGELKVIMNYLNDDQKYRYFSIEPGDRIAQIVFLNQENYILEEVNILTETNRGANGFGSTGR